MSIYPSKRHQELQNIINRHKDSKKKRFTLPNLWEMTIHYWKHRLIERALATFVRDLESLAIFKLLSLLTNITIIVSLVAFLINGERYQHNQQIFGAWQTITNAHEQAGSGGRIQALEFLNSSPGSPGRRRWFGAVWSPVSLAGVDLRRAHLIGVYLPEAILRSANFQNADLGGANFQNGDLQYVELQNSRLDYSNLQGVNLKHAKLQNANLQYANLANANLLSANLQNTNLQFVNLKGAYLGGVNLQNSNLQATDLEDTYLDGADLQDAFLAFSKLPKINPAITNLKSAVLLGNDLTQIDVNLESLLTTDGQEPYICKVKLTENVNIDPDRDCEKIVEMLLDYFVFVPQHSSPGNPRFIKFSTVEGAQQFIQNLDRDI